MDIESRISLLDRFRGCLLGQAVGDALGAPFETMPADAIYYGFGSVRKIVARPPVEVLQYTDDTQMMIGVAEVLAEHGRMAAKTMFPGGSFGNGSAMRAAPVGLMFHDDLDRAAHEAELSSMPTHAHAIAIDGARAVAVGVAVAMWPDFGLRSFYDEILRHTFTAE